MYVAEPFLVCEVLHKGGLVVMYQADSLKEAMAHGRRLAGSCERTFRITCGGKVVGEFFPQPDGSAFWKGK